MTAAAQTSGPVMNGEYYKTSLTVFDPFIWLSGRGKEGRLMLDAGAGDTGDITLLGSGQKF